MRRLLVFLLAALALAGCSGDAATPPPPDPTELITQAADNIRSVDTFRMEVIASGAPYIINTDLGQVAFRRAVAQYVAPDNLQAEVRLIAAGLPADVEIFAQGEQQWYRNSILTANRWVNAPFAPGFNPALLIAEDTGFEVALNALIDLQYVGETDLDGVIPVYHLRGTARGEDIVALLAGLIDEMGMVEVDVYIEREQRVPARFIIVDLDTEAEETEPTTFTVDIYDVNAPPELDLPPGVTITPGA